MTYRKKHPPDVPYGVTFHTNFDKSDYNIYLRIIRRYRNIYPDAKFYISQYAYDSYGRPLRNHLSLWDNLRSAYPPFHKMYTEERKDNKSFIKSDEMLL